MLAAAASDYENAHAYGRKRLEKLDLPAMPKIRLVMLEKDGISLYDTASVVVDVRPCYA